MLSKLLLDTNLSRKQASTFFRALLAEQINYESARTLLILLREKGESAIEIYSGVTILRSKARTLKAEVPYLVDNCGTGGDGKSSINISTIAAFVAAGAGAYVAKHGNRSASSKVGSADLLEALGVNIMAKPDRMLRSLHLLGIAYFHAPLYHPIFKILSPIRRRIRSRTIFNLMGPLLNPLNVRRQVIGVYRKEFIPVFAETLRLLGTERSFVICGENGMDEATPYGITHGLEIRGNRFFPFEVRARTMGFHPSTEAAIRGGSLKDNKAIALGILSGAIRGAKRDAVILNAGLTLLASGKISNLKEGMLLSEASLQSGKAFGVLKRFVEITNR